MIYQEKNRLKPKALSYLQSFLIALGIIASGFVLQLAIGGIHIASFKSPVNLNILLLIIIFILIGHFKFKHKSLVVWLSSTKAAISSIVGFSFISILMGFITQEETTNQLVKNLGLNNIVYSWAYIFSLLFLVISLGFATIKRLYPFRKQNFWYLLNHLGLWITIVAANFGFPDQTHLRMNISTAQHNNYAYDELGGMVGLPFEIIQTDFKLENYLPKLAIMDSETSMNSIKKGTNTVEVAENTSKQLKDWSIQIIKYYPSARKVSSDVFAIDTVGSAPAAYVRVENTITKKISEGWVSVGNLLFDKSSISLDASHTLAMMFPQQKEMSLGISILANETNIDKTIAVNSPQKFDGWNMYIFSFNQQQGKWSQASVIELIKDTWQPFVYLGLGMMIIGSFFVFWRGKK